jgi:hypothetical protein
VTDATLTELERELPELRSLEPNMGETTATLDEEMLKESPSPPALVECECLVDA